MLAEVMRWIVYELILEWSSPVCSSEFSAKKLRLCMGVFLLKSTHIKHSFFNRGNSILKEISLIFL